MGNFNILTSTELNSKAKCRILCSDIQLSVLYNFIFRCTSESSPKYLLMWTIRSLSKRKRQLYIWLPSKFLPLYYILWEIWQPTKNYIQPVCQNIIFHGLFWWLSKHNIWSSSKSTVWIIYFDSQSNLLPTEHPFNARSQTTKCPLTAHLVSLVVNHSPILKCNHGCRMIVIYLHANYLLTWFSLTSLTRIS